MMKKLLLMVMTLIMAVAMVGCSSQQAAQPAEKVLKVGLDANFPPFEYYQESTKAYTGVDIEIMNALAKEMGYSKVDYVNVSFSKLLNSLNEKQFDVAMGALAITEERKQIVTFANPYVKDGFKIIVPVNSTMTDEVAGLAGKKVAVEKDSHGATLAKKQGAILVEAADTEAAIKVVVYGNADCVVASGLSAEFFIANGYGDKVKLAGEKMLLADEIAMAVRHDDKEMLVNLNKALQEIQRSGQYKKIMTSYFGK